MTKLEEIKERSRNYILNRLDNSHLQSLLAQNIIDKNWLIEKLEEAIEVIKYYRDDTHQGYQAREFLGGLK